MTALRTRSLLLGTAAVLVVAGCSAGQTADEPSGGTTGGAEGEDARTDITIGFGAEPISFDFTQEDGVAIPEALLVNVYEGLVAVDDAGEIVPALASEWTVSDDGTVYDFTLNEGVTFSNGDEFTADDVKFSIERVQSDAWSISLKSGMDIVDSVEVVDDTHARVTLSAPSNSWLYTMTTRVGAMFSETGVDNLAEDPVGTGPYDVSDRTPGESITLTRRDDYWGEEPALETVTLRYFQDGNALNNALLAGDIDVISNASTPESVDAQFGDAERFQIVEGATNGELVLSMNNTRAPFDDPLVRQAVMHALDRQAILDAALGGYGTVIGSMVPPHDPWFDETLVDRYPHDPARAEQLLADAGHPDGIDVVFRPGSLPVAAAAVPIIEDQLAQVGIRATVDTQEFPAQWIDVVLQQGDYDMSLMRHAEPRDIATFANPDYYWHYDSQEFRDALQAADTGAPDQYAEQMRAASALLTEDAAAGFLYVTSNVAVAATGVTGLPTNRPGEAYDVTNIAWS